jgi:hypothetical protein
VWLLLLSCCGTFSLVSRLAVEESFSWHHHFGPSPAFFYDLSVF